MSRDASPAAVPSAASKAADAAVGIVAAALVGLALWVAADGLIRLNTWYLASDQFAFLTFSRDLRQGTVFHEDPSWSLIAPKSRLSFDALAQTYFWRDGKLFSRYPPGFPALLAAAGALFGEAGEHALNPVLFLLAMLVLALAPVALLPGRRRLAAAVGASAVWLLLLLPTEIHLWGITVARDLPAHLCGLLAVLAAVRGRFVLSGFVLGLAAVIRPDAVLYGSSIACLALLDRLPLSRALLSTGAFLVGALPLFAYNWVTQGSPLSFTQGGEFRDVLGAAPGPVAVVAQTISFASGGAFRLANLAASLPGNLAHFVQAFGWMLLAGLLGLLWAWRHERRVIAALLPYSSIAIVFYSFWSHPDARYLAGVSLCLLPLIALGLVVAAERVARTDASWFVRLGAVALAVLAVLGVRGLLPAWLPPPTRPAWLSAAAIAVTALAARPLARGRSMFAGVLATLVPPITLAALGIVAFATGAERRDPFRQEQVQHARATLEGVVPAGSLVITDSALGRPAENITHYTGIRAFYGSELSLLGVPANTVVVQHKLAGKRVFYLLDPQDRYSLQELSAQTFRPRVVARRRGVELLDWFVNPREAGRGAVLYEIDFDESWKKQVDELVAAGVVPAYPGYEAPSLAAPSDSRAEPSDDPDASGSRSAP